MALCRALAFLATRKQENKDGKFLIQSSVNSRSNIILSIVGQT